VKKNVNFKIKNSYFNFKKYSGQYHLLHKLLQTFAHIIYPFTDYRSQASRWWYKNARLQRIFKKTWKKHLWLWIREPN